jgi:hypothetical protein
MKNKRSVVSTWIFNAAGALAFLAGAIYAGLVWHDSNLRAAELYERGLIATGEVLDIAVSAGGVNGGGADKIRHYVTYRFVDSIGAPTRA